MDDRPLPHDADAERCVIGCLLQDPEGCMSSTVGTLDPEAFYLPSHRRIYAEIGSMVSEGRGVDLITLQGSLEASGELESVGGTAALTELFTMVPTTSHLKFYRGIIEQKHTLRKVAMAAMEAYGKAMSVTNEECLKVAEGAAESMSSILSGGGTDDRTMDGRGCVSKAVAEIESNIAMGDKARTFTGVEPLDELTGGMWPGEMVVVGARPSQGKTAIALQALFGMAVAQKKRVLFFSGEMPVEDVTIRMIASESGVPFNMVKSGVPPLPAQRVAVVNATQDVKFSGLHIDDTPNPTIGYILAKAKAMHRKKPLDFIAVDYLQKVRHRGFTPNQRVQEISEVITSFKEMLKALRVPGIMLAQLNRGPQNGEKTRRPRMSDFEGAGKTEQEADYVVLIDRPECGDRDVLYDDGELIMPKARNGGVGSIDIEFVRGTMRFQKRRYNKDF